MGRRVRKGNAPSYNRSSEDGNNDIDLRNARKLSSSDLRLQRQRTWYIAVQIVNIIINEKIKENKGKDYVKITSNDFIVTRLETDRERLGIDGLYYTVEIQAKIKLKFAPRHNMMEESVNTATISLDYVAPHSETEGPRTPHVGIRVTGHRKKGESRNVIC